MDDILTPVISVIGSAVISFLVAKYYGERWVEKRRSRMEHSNKLKDDFFKSWLGKIGEYNDEYCKIDAQYSKEIRKMVPLKLREPDNLSFYGEAMSHLKNYEKLLKDWEKLKQTTFELNEELAILFEEIRLLVNNEVDVPYWCPRYSGDQPDEYLCPNSFIRSIYDEMYWKVETSRKQIHGNGEIIPTYVAHDKLIYYLRYASGDLASSPNEELVKKAQQLFSRFIEDEKYRARIKTFMDKQKDTYYKELELVKQNIRESSN